MAKIFSIIVTYNGASWIEKCLDDLLLSQVPTEIIVIDNASTDETLHLLEKYTDQIQLKKSRFNLGFGQANNMGIIHAMKEGADFIFLLNQDAYIFPDTIGRLVESLEKNTEFGVISPLQLSKDKESIEPIFRNFLRNNFEENLIQKMWPQAEGLVLDRPLSMRFVNAAAWMMSRQCIDKVGLFHPVFFHYGEDNHYSSRVQFHEFKIGVLPSALVVHDCKKEEKGAVDLLKRKIRDVPLYTLLDLRKSFPLAYLLGYLKWKRLAKKLLKFRNPEILELIEDQKKWFTVNLSKVRSIRKETKSPKKKW